MAGSCHRRAGVVSQPAPRPTFRTELPSATYRYPFANDTPQLDCIATAVALAGPPTLPATVEIRQAAGALCTPRPTVRKCGLPQNRSYARQAVPAMWVRVITTLSGSGTRGNASARSMSTTDASTAAPATGRPLGWSRASNAPQGGGSDGRDHR